MLTISIELRYRQLQPISDEQFYFIVEIDNFRHLLPQPRYPFPSRSIRNPEPLKTIYDIVSSNDDAKKTNSRIAPDCSQHSHYV